MKPDVSLIAITCADGSLAVMHFVLAEYNTDGTVRWKRAASQGAVAAEIARTAWEPDKLPIQNWRFIDWGDIPQDRTYRKAWTDTGSAIEHDVAKARVLHQDILRDLRRPMMADLDGQWMRAMGQGDKAEAARIEDERQRLRDLPQDARIDAAKTVEELKALLP